jgi:putative tricarboxylic transport membrane protein
MSEGVSSSPSGGPNSGAGSRTNNFRGGLLIAIAALLLFLLTFSMSSPSPFHMPTRALDVLAIIFDPRVLSIALGVVGVVTAFGLVPVRAPQDYYGGLVLIMLATVALIASADLPGQRGFAFGPGTAPRLFAGVLLVLSAAVSVIGVTSRGPQIEPYKLRGPLWVLLAIALFAMMIRPFGLVVASWLVFMISIQGSSERRWIESAIAATCMTGFCVLLFVYLLNLPFQLWPQPNAHMVLWSQVVEFFGLTFGPLMKFFGVM